MGAATGSVEHRVRDRLGGRSRRETLRWLEPYRRSANRLRTPDIVLLGAYDRGIPSTLDGVLALEARLGAPLPLVQVYSAWGDKADQRFPVELLTAITGLGSIPLVTWEPWLTDFESVRHPGIPLREQRDSHALAAVGRGDYDFYIDAWAAAASRFGRPMFLRFAHEMNDPYRYPWGRRTIRKRSTSRHGATSSIDSAVRVQPTSSGCGRRTWRTNTGTCTTRATPTLIGLRPASSTSARSRSGRGGGASVRSSASSIPGWRRSESR